MAYNNNTLAKKPVSGLINASAKQAQQPEMQYLAMLGHSAFPDTEAMIVIRPHNDIFSGAKFEAMMIATRLRYSRFKLVMADTLECHILGTRTEGKEAAAEWLVQNAQYLTDKEINSIMRWSDIIDDANFERKYETLKLLYHSNDDARYYINMKCADRMRALVTQKQRANEKFDEKKLMQSVLNYRLEELAGLSVLRDQKDIPELCVEDFVGDDLLYDRLSSTKLKMPRIYPVTFQIVEKSEPLSFED